MARTQTKSGGFVVDETVSFPVYVLLHNSTVEVAAALNTGPSFTPPAAYASWGDGPHILVFPRGATLAALVKSVKVKASGGLTVWNGADWVGKVAKVWNGSTWVSKPTKTWNGSSWS